MTPRTDRWPLRILLTGILVLLACGEARAPQQFVWEETFENVCEGDIPCGWERVDGDADDVRYVSSSFHPGEHALALSGTGAVRGPGGEAEFANFPFGTLEARFVGRCDAGAGIDIVLGIQEESVPDGGAADMTMLTTIFMPETWSERTESILVTSESAFVDGGLGPPLAGGGQFRVTSVFLQMNGPGTCEIAEILIDDPGSTRRTLEDGC